MCGIDIDEVDINAEPERDLGEIEMYVYMCWLSLLCLEGCIRALES